MTSSSLVEAEVEVGVGVKVGFGVEVWVGVEVRVGVEVGVEVVVGRCSLDGVKCFFGQGWVGVGGKMN